MSNTSHTAELHNEVCAALERREYAAARELLAQLRELDATAAAGLLVSSYVEEGDADGAATALAELRGLAPEDVYTKFLSARVAAMNGNYLAAYRGLQRIDEPGQYAEQVYNLLGRCARELGESERSCRYYEQACEAAPTPELAAREYSNALFNRHYHDKHTLLAARRKLAARYNDFFAGVAPLTTLTSARHVPEDSRIQLGYISSDIRNHVVLRFAWAMLTQYDRKRFTVTVYQHGEEDDYSRQVAGQVTRWRNVAGMTSPEIARLIYNDGIDILVDLNGHTQGTALPVLAYKPAPVQISGVGYFASTGLSAVDYFLGDNFLDRDGQQLEFTEKLLRLPHSHLCYAPKELLISSVMKAPCLARGCITFGSFNNFTKVTAEVLRAWAKIMEQLPDAQLVVKASMFNREDMGREGLERMAAAGIDLGRVEARPTTAKYLHEYADVDIALDTFPYPGGGTTADALYMGVPVITMTQDSHGSRFGGSMLHALGLDALVTHSRNEYIARAVGLANDFSLVATLHQTLRRRMEHSPLMNMSSYMQELESAYQTVWQRYTEERRAALERVIVGAIDGNDLPAAMAGVTALELARSSYGYGWFLAANVEFAQGNIEEALIMAQQAQMSGQLTRLQEGALFNLMAKIAKQKGNRADAAQQFLESAERKDLEHGKLADYSNYLLNLAYTEPEPAKMLAAAKGYGALLVEIPRYEYGKERAAHDRLRVGYISPDFNRSVAASFMAAFFTGYDALRYEVYGYALCADDPVSATWRTKCKEWRNLVGKTPEEAARIIHDDEIDILVDLAGHTGETSTLPVLAYKPAPVIISGIGYFSTIGLDTVDWFLVDSHTAPEGEDECFAEKLLRLPKTHWCYAPVGWRPLYTEPAPCHSNGHVTFGSLADFDKVTDGMLGAWQRILAAVPNSRLFLKCGAFDSEVRKAGVVKKLAKAGIDFGRVDTEGRTDDYWKAYNRIDIALDTYPYVGGGTTADALYMGVPVVTLAGQHHHQRFGLSMLANAGLEDLCATTLDGYVEAAVKLANDSARLGELHLTLRRILAKTPLLDAPTYMNDLEDAYEKAWHAWQQGVGLELPDREALTKQLNELENAADWTRVAQIMRNMYARMPITGSDVYLIAKAYYYMKDYPRTIIWTNFIKDGANWRGDLSCMRGWAWNQMGNYLQAYEELVAGVDERLMSAGQRDWAIGLVAWLAYTQGLTTGGYFYKLTSEETTDYKRRLAMYSSFLMVQNANQVNEEQLFQWSRHYDELLGDIKQYTHDLAHHNHERIRVGYASPDFRSHVMLRYVWVYVTQHDKSKFEVFAYSLSAAEDGYTKTLRETVGEDHWRKVADKEWDEIARIIYEDEIDILVDFGGHAAGNGLPTFAYKPAPVQISGIGYMSSTGMKTMDYFITDKWVDPVGLHEKIFTEKPMYLTSECCYVPVEAKPCEGAPCVTRGWVLFGVFNHYRKVTNAMLSVWKEILDELPTAKILFKSQNFFGVWNVDDAYDRLKTMGFNMDQIIIEPATSNYLERYRDVDIALDTYPYPGGGTTCDTLYMGVPIVTYYGNRRSSRLCASMLAAVNLAGDCAVVTRAQYKATVLRLARDPQLLDRLHKEMRGRITKSPLMDAKRYISEVEAQYRQMMATWRESLTAITTSSD